MRKGRPRQKQPRRKQEADPAATVIRGFRTPATSGGEESDISTISTPLLRSRSQNLPALGCSPVTRPASPVGGISALKIAVDKLSAQGVQPPPLACTASYPATETSRSSRSGSISASDHETYEVPLSEDFISADAESSKPNYGYIEGGVPAKSVHCKMTAEDFQPLKCLGKGAFGTVILVKQHATGRLYAQKQLKKASLTIHKRLVEQTKTERAILESVNRHPFIVNLYYAFQDHEKLYLILEYAQGGELFNHLAMERMFSEEAAAFYMAQMVLALSHLHGNLGVVYRDLKPENCLLDAEGHLLLTDFGLSKVAIEEECNSFLGTIEYMAPEVISGSNYSFAVDWWSLGALGYDLMTGSPPFPGNNHKKIQEKIVKQKLTLPYFLSPDAKDLLTRLLRKEPHKRLGSNMPKDLQTIKAHRFFRKLKWKDVENRVAEPPIKPLITDPEAAENFSSDFTDLMPSPVIAKNGWQIDGVGKSGESDPFGGFSFVASRSLLECEGWRE